MTFRTDMPYFLLFWRVGACWVRRRIRMAAVRFTGWSPTSQRANVTRSTPTRLANAAWVSPRRRRVALTPLPVTPQTLQPVTAHQQEARGAGGVRVPGSRPHNDADRREIGRASCRER